MSEQKKTSSSQIFRITRAPEAEPLDHQQLRSLLWRNRKDSQWEVTELELEQAKLIPTCVAEYKRRQRSADSIRAGRRRIFMAEST